MFSLGTIYIKALLAAQYRTYNHFLCGVILGFQGGSQVGNITGLHNQPFFLNDQTETITCSNYFDTFLNGSKQHCILGIRKEQCLF